MAEEKTESKRPFLKTADLKLGKPLPFKPRPLERITTHEITGRDGGPTLTDGMFLMRFADDEDLKILKAILVERIKKRERGPFYFSCEKCGWTGKFPRLVEEGKACLACNRNQREDGGTLKRLRSEKAILAYEEAVKELRMKNIRARKKMAAAMSQDWRQRVARGEFG